MNTTENNNFICIALFYSTICKGYEGQIIT